MSGFTAAGIATDTVSTTQLAPLGFILTVPNGDFGVQEWVYIKNVGATTLTTGLTCMTDDTDAASKAKPYEVEITPRNAVHSASKLIGAAQHEIKTNEYGFVLKRGKGKLQAGGAVSAADSLMTDSGNVAGDEGQVITLTGTINKDAVLGVALTDGTDTNDFDALVKFGI